MKKEMKKKESVMTQEQRLEYLVCNLLEETPEYKDITVPKAVSEQQRLLRSLMNIRPPVPASKEFLEIQDDYLQGETAGKGITDGDGLPPLSAEPKIALWQGDITTLKVDAIVNAANSTMLGCFVPNHGCIDNVIHTYAGIQLRLECHEMMEKQGYQEPTGYAKITRAYNLPSSYILHTVGPIISGPLKQNDCDLLASCYRSCLELAEAHNLKTIAFCCISTGEFHFPQDKAAEIAIETVRTFLSGERQIQKVIFNVFKEEDHGIYRKLLEQH